MAYIVGMDRDYDVIVIGSGAAGLSAAVAAADEGASVLIVEGDKQVGGSSRLSGGHFYAAGTSVQEEAGVIGDTPDAMFEHYMTLNQWLVDPAVVRQYCDQSAPTFEWVKNLGVKFSKEGVYPSGVGSTPRGHQPEGGRRRSGERPGWPPQPQRCRNRFEFTGERVVNRRRRACKWHQHWR